MNNTLTILTAPLIACTSLSCSTPTRIVTHPHHYRVLVNGKECGKSPASLTLFNRTFGGYRVTLVDEDRREVFQGELPLEFQAWGIFWPPLGFLYNLFGASPYYEIDASVASPDGGTALARPSDERDQPPSPSSRPEAVQWTDEGFRALDRGWLSHARPYFVLAHRADPGYPDAMLGLAVYHRQKGEHEASEEWIARYQTARDSRRPGAGEKTAGRSSR